MSIKPVAAKAPPLPNQRRNKTIIPTATTPAKAAGIREEASESPKRV